MAILDIYEAYRLKFQEMKCKEGQTFLEFPRQKEALFKRWCTSQQIGNSFETLKQLILLEEFKSCVTANIKAYLEEQKVEELHRAATLSDDYKLSHQSFSSASDCKDPSNVLIHKNPNVMSCVLEADGTLPFHSIESVSFFS